MGLNLRLYPICTRSVPDLYQTTNLPPSLPHKITCFLASTRNTAVKAPSRLSERLSGENLLHTQPSILKPSNRLLVKTSLTTTASYRQLDTTRVSCAKLNPVSPWATGSAVRGIDRKAHGLTLRKH